MCFSCNVSKKLVKLLLQCHKADAIKLKKQRIDFDLLQLQTTGGRRAIPEVLNLNSQLTTEFNSKIKFQVSVESQIKS